MKTPWCTEPFNVIENKVWGNWGLCCRSAPLPYSGKDVSPLEHFNSDLMKEIRRDMIDHNITDNIKKYCHKCLEHESNNVRSMRQDRQGVSLRQGGQLPTRAIQSAIDNDGEIKDFEFRSVEIKFFGNLCNLQCKMCGPAYSSSIAAAQKKQGIYDGPVHINVFANLADDTKAQFYKDLEQILPHTTMLKFTGGEPMMNRGVVEMIQWIVDRGYNTGLTINIITNGTQVNHELLELGSKFKRFIIALSIDGMWEVNDYQRVGADFSEINDNISIFKQYAGERNIIIYAAITAITVSSLEELVVYAKMRKLDINLSSFVLTPRYLQVKVLPIEYRNDLIKKYGNPVYKHIVKALQDPEWDEDLWKLFLKNNPEIGSIVPELRKYIV